MRMNEQQLNRATLARQMLLVRESVSVIDGIRHAVALQAQEPASPYIALWNRIDGFDPTDLDGAFRDGDVVKATLMRATLHAVHRDDYTTFQGAMADRLRARLNDNRFVESGLSPADFDVLVSVIAEHASEPRTVPEIEAMLENHLGEPPHKGIWWAVRNVGPVQHAPTDAPWSFGPRNAFVAAPERPRRTDSAQWLPDFIWRYLEGFGPASAKDFGQFTLQTQAAIKPALESMAGELVTYEGPNGEVLHDVPNGQIPDGDMPAPPRLMAMWDSVFLAYADRTRLIPEEYRKTMIRSNGDVLPTLLVDGKVAGLWRATDDGIEARTFRKLAQDDWDALSVEAQNLLAMLERDPRVYSRYNRWWSSIEGVETRILK
jgi:DNA glycosylase AlkZ-like